MVLRRDSRKQGRSQTIYERAKKVFFMKFSRQKNWAEICVRGDFLSLTIYQPFIQLTSVDESGFLFDSVFFRFFIGVLGSFQILCANLGSNNRQIRRNLAGGVTVFLK